MALSIGSLQLRSTIQPWRKVEIKRRTGATYESGWLDVSKYVTRWPEISFETDTVNIFNYRIGSAQISFRNDEKQFSQETFYQSLFGGYLTRYKTQVRISTGLEDDNGTQYPASNQQIFYGLFDEINDNETDSNVTVLSTMSLLQNLPASILPTTPVRGISLTAKELIGYIRDAQDSSGNYILTPFISSSAWLLTCTGETYVVSTMTSLFNLTAFEFINRLAKAENHTFYIDKTGNFNFKPRTAGASSVYSFNGAGERNVNIEAIESYTNGVMNTYTKVTCNISTDLKITNSESYTVGDNSSSWKYGIREFSWDNPYTNIIDAVTQNTRLLTELQTPKSELILKTKYIAPNIDIHDRVTVTIKGEIGGDGSTWDNFLWDYNMWSDEKGGILIDNVDYKVIGIKVNMNDFYTKFFLKEV
jgi:hypothetical protein